MGKKNPQLKKKIYNNMYLMTICFTFFVTAVLSIGFFLIFESQVKGNVKSTAKFLQDNFVLQLENVMGLNHKTISQTNIRMTVIDKDGVVVYDSHILKETLENHGDRPEVLGAIANGSSEVSRFSDTFLEKTFYYAVQLDSGNILRTSQSTKSIYSIFITIIGLLVGVVLLCAIACHFFANRLTSKLVRPINEVNIALDEPVIYEELTPFVQTMKAQEKRRQEFSANVSHELKTPLTTISGYSEMISSGIAKEEDITLFSDKIHKEATRMLSLINDIIRLSELDERSDEYRFIKVNLLELANSVSESLQYIADEKQVVVAVRGENISVNGDGGMLEELFYNLIENAIKYNKVGGKVIATIAQMPSNIEIIIEDTGIGIDSEYHHRVFERFYRVDKSRSKKTGGTGLGLAIVKHIIVVHKGTIKLESVKNKGTKITVALPK